MLPCCTPSLKAHSIRRCSCSVVIYRFFWVIPPHSHGLSALDFAVIVRESCISAEVPSSTSSSHLLDHLSHGCVFPPSAASTHSLIFSITVCWTEHLIFSSLPLLLISNSPLIPLGLKFALPLCTHQPALLGPALDVFSFLSFSSPLFNPYPYLVYLHPFPVPSSIVLLWQTQVLVHFVPLPPSPLL